jgi:CDP-4-dehydro-6-deoxyglucose reductase
MSHARITLLPAGTIIEASHDETLLDAALRVGLNLPHSCKGGHCASCRARVIEGEIRYPGALPLGLTAQEHACGYALLCQAHAASAQLTIEIHEIRAPIDVQVKSMPCRIERLERLAPDVMAVFLRLPAAEEFVYLAGQYVDILLSQLRRRSFSIANAPGASKLLELHVKRVAGGEFTEQVFEHLKPGALLRMEGPLGQFWFRTESPRPALLIGGGTGYAPLRAMLQSLLDAGDQRPLHLYWGVRNRADLYEHEQLIEWTRRHPTLRYTPVLSEPSPEDRWSGRTDFVHRAALEDHRELASFDVYAAGPPALVESVRHEFPEHGLPSDQLFFDSFDFAPDALAKISPLKEWS